jgi:hypothetical protein
MTGIRISKKELLKRLDERSRSRYGGGFLESWYDTLTDSGLIDRLERGPNAGLAPVYFATRVHYRRALQLRRMYSRGITGRDPQLIQLFSRGYGVQAHQVAGALRGELIRVINKLRPMLRSGYFQNSREPGPKHSASVERQMGPLDPRFETAGLKQPLKFYLEFIRSAFGAGPGHFSGMIEGILLERTETDSLPEIVESALKFDRNAFLAVRSIFKLQNQLIFRPMVGDAVIDSPELTVGILAVMLVANKAGFSNHRILCSLPSPEGFEALIAGALDVLVKQNPGSSGPR